MSGEAEPRPLTPRDWIGFAALGCGMFMAILDVQIVTASLGEIRAGLGATADEISWIQTSYLIGEVIMIPLTGILSRLLSTRVLFTASAIGFTLASLACALADSLAAMIVWRTIQGFLGGAMIPTLFVAIFTLFPQNRRGAAMAAVTVIGTLAPTFGPALGGWITELLSWHWLFLINLVPGPLVALAAWTTIRWDRPDPSVARGFDLMGLACLAIGLGCLQYVLEEGARHDWFEDGRILLAALVSAGALAGLVARVTTHPNPIVNPRPFRHANFALGCGYSAVIGVMVFGSVFLSVLFMVLVSGFSSGTIGFVMGMSGLVQLLATPFTGWITDRVEPRRMLTAALLFALGSAVINTTMTAQWGMGDHLLPQILRGLAILLLFPPVSLIAFNGLPPPLLKDASGIFNVCRMLGGAAGIAGLNSYLLARQDVHLAHLSEQLAPGNAGMRAMLDRLAARHAETGAPLPEEAALTILSRLLEREALVLAFNDSFRLLVALLVAALILVPLLRPGGAARRAAPVEAIA